MCINPQHFEHLKIVFRVSSYRTCPYQTDFFSKLSLRLEIELLSHMNICIYKKVDAFAN